MNLQALVILINLKVRGKYVCHDSNDNVEEVREQLLTFSSKLCLTDDILPNLES